jgi:SanA protein
MRVLKWFLAALASALVIVTVYANTRLQPVVVCQSYDHPFEYGVVLGTSPEGFFGGPNPYFTERMEAAERCLRMGRVKRLILSGGPGEPEAMHNFLRQKGVMDDLLVLDDKGTNTRRSIQNAWQIAGGPSVAVISQAFHIERARYLAEREGITVYSGCRAKDPQNPVVMLREYLARAKAVLL